MRSLSSNTMAESLNIEFALVPEGDLESAVNIEQDGYPQDEAGSIESFRFRQSRAGELFLGAYLTKVNSRELIGYVCSTLSPSDTLTHESMSTHVPNSSSVCVHSVCVSPLSRRKGVGLRLLNKYISRLHTMNGLTAKENPQGRSTDFPYKQVLLLTHEELLSFYRKAGFELVGKSDVVHGSKPWFLMRQDLTNSSTKVDIHGASPPEQVHSRGEQLPPGLWESLQSALRNRQSGRLIASFPTGIKAVCAESGGSSVNKYDLLCPRPGCGSIILKQQSAQLVERSSVQMEPASLPKSPLLPSLPAPPAMTEWWLVTPSPVAFENIGFSRPLQGQSQSGPKLRLLACAECDLGPLGWSEEGGSEFWLACSRVSYRE